MAGLNAGDAMSMCSEEYLNGKHAFRNGVPLTGNPHPEGCRDFNQWNQGWKLEKALTERLAALGEEVWGLTPV